MKKSRFSEEKIIAVLKQAEAGVKVSELVRKLGISEATFYNWKAKYGGLDASQLRRLKERAGPVLLNNCTVSDKWTSLRVRLPGASAASGSKTGRASRGQGSSAVGGRCRTRSSGAASRVPQRRCRRLSSKPPRASRCATAAR